MTPDKKKFEIECVQCGKKVKSRKVSFCPSCKRELYTPRIPRRWSYKTLILIFMVISVMYLIYLIFSPQIYFHLDRIIIA